MIVTNNALYLHMPKTGGNWVREVLKSITIEDFGHRLPSNDFHRPNVYLFVRNPWQWYNSLYHYLIYGSEIYNPADNFIDPLIRAFGNTPSFAEFTETLCCPTDMYKKKVSILSKSSDLVRNTSQSPFWEMWLSTSGSLYDVVSSNFIATATKIGTTENIAADLRQMLVESGDLNSEIDLLLNTAQHKNVENRLVSYQTLYTDHLRIVVADSSKPLIDRFNYKF